MLVQQGWGERLKKIFNRNLLKIVRNYVNVLPLREEAHSCYRTGGWRTWWRRGASRQRRSPQSRPSSWQPSVHGNSRHLSSSLQTFSAEIKIFKETSRFDLTSHWPNETHRQTSRLKNKTPMLGTNNLKGDYNQEHQEHQSFIFLLY